MSKLDELIQELCPDGVEYKKLGEISNISRGRVMSKDYIKNNIGQFPVYSSQTENNGELGKIAPYDFDGEYLTWTTDGANAGSVFYRNGKFSITNVCGLIKVKNELVNTKYLYYALTIETHKYVNSGMGNPKLMSNVMVEVKVPVPPLEVQCEIVHILDKFTLLTAELTAELTARRKQYEYYRNYILNNVKAEKKELSDVCDFLRGPFGSSLKKEYFKESGYVVYEQQHAIYQKLDFRYFIDADKFSQLKRFEVKPGELIVSCSGTIGKVFVIPENAPKGIINQALLNLKPKDFVKAKYIKYFFENTLGEVLNNSARGGAIKNVPSVGELKKIKIYIPCKDEQKKIISTLDRFDKLCNDITSGIPAEIEVRQKQYEYYRDKLLTFKEKNNE